MNLQINFSFFKAIRDSEEKLEANEKEERLVVSEKTFQSKSTASFRK